MSGINGFPTQQKTGNARPKYVTTQTGGKDRYGLQVAPIGLFPTTALPDAVDSYDADLGIVEITGHGAREGDVLRVLQAGANNRIEIPILEIIDADHIKIAKEVLVTNLTALDEIRVLRPITASYNEDGNVVVAVNVGPISYRLDGVSNEVAEDTLTVANNRPLPTQEMVDIDGVKIPIHLDTAVPANNVGKPVRNLNADGTFSDVDLVRVKETIEDEDVPILAGDAGVKNVGKRLDMASYQAAVIAADPNTFVSAEGDAIQARYNEYGAQHTVDLIVLDELQEIKTEIQLGLKQLDVVDMLDATLLSVLSSNIPASASAPLEVVAVLAADVKEIQIVDDIGEFVGLYTGLATFEVLKAVLPLGGGVVKMEVAAGTRISLRNMKNAVIGTNTFMAINFLG